MGMRTTVTEKHFEDMVLDFEDGVVGPVYGYDADGSFLVLHLKGLSFAWRDFTSGETLWAASLNEEAPIEIAARFRLLMSRGERPVEVCRLGVDDPSEYLISSKGIESLARVMGKRLLPPERPTVAGTNLPCLIADGSEVSMTPLDYDPRRLPTYPRSTNRFTPRIAGENALNRLCRALFNVSAKAGDMAGVAGTDACFERLASGAATALEQRDFANARLLKAPFTPAQGTTWEGRLRAQERRDGRTSFTLKDEEISGPRLEFPSPSSLPIAEAIDLRRDGPRASDVSYMVRQIIFSPNDKTWAVAWGELGTTLEQTEPSRSLPDLSLPWFEGIDLIDLTDAPQEIQRDYSEASRQLASALRQGAEA